MVMAIKVSQATIDKIKKMGMTKALKSAPKANAEMTEALRRMYGQRRLDAATKATPMKQPRQGVLPKAVQPRQGVLPKSSAPSAVSGKKVSTTSAKKPTPKKSGPTDPFARFVFGAGRAITSGQGAQGMTRAQVAAENKRRADAVAKAKKNK
jgi:hypothetical protein